MWKSPRKAAITCMLFPLLYISIEDFILFIGVYGRVQINQRTKRDSETWSLLGMFRMINSPSSLQYSLAEPKSMLMLLTLKGTISACQKGIGFTRRSKQETQQITTSGKDSPFNRTALRRSGRCGSDPLRLRGCSDLGFTLPTWALALAEDEATTTSNFIMLAWYLTFFTISIVRRQDFILGWIKYVPQLRATFYCFSCECK